MSNFTSTSHKCESACRQDSYYLLLIRVDTSGCSGTKMSKVVSATASHTCTDTNGLLTTNL